MNRSTVPVLSVMVLTTIATARPAGAQDADFQAFFFDACMNPTGDLATRCGETPGGSGDLSADSENSLNPGQILAAHEGSLYRARERTRGIQALLEARREETPGQDAAEARQFTERLGLILAARGAWFDRDSTSRERGLDGDSWGLQAGADYRVSDATVVGGLFNYDRPDAEFDDDQPGINFTPFSQEGEQDADSYIFTFFGSHSFTDNLYVDGHVGGGYIDYDLKRDVVFQEATRTVAQTPVNTRADVDGWEFSTSGGVGYELALGPATLGPYGRVVYIRSWIDNFDENGGNGLAMEYPDEARDSLTTILGLRGTLALSTRFGVLVPQARIEWEHEYLRDSFNTRAFYILDADRNNFQMKGDSNDRNYLNVGAGFAFVLPGGWIPFADYEGLFEYENWSFHRVTGGLRKEFQ